MDVGLFRFRLIDICLFCGSPLIDVGLFYGCFLIDIGVRWRCCV